MSESFSHFKNKSTVEHLKDARLKGSKASAEIHGTEAPGSIIAGTDGAREIAIYLSIVTIIFYGFLLQEQRLIYTLAIFSLGLIIWKTARSASLGWVRLERLHRLIKEEYWEIQHNRPQEKEELKEMYAAKGFKGKLLDDVVEVLMADDNRLLQVMLQEELGLSLEFLEHPIKQALGAFIGTLISSVLILLGALTLNFMGVFIASGVIIIFSSAISCHFHRNNMTKSIIWSLSISALALGVVYFLSPLFIKAWG